MHKTGSSGLLVAAIVLFAIGLLAIAALFLTPVLSDGSTAPTAIYLLTMCAPLGFLLGIAAALRAGRRVNTK
ncbi:hypothetical protein QSJ18_13735 [Gordonia sp. ABSL1-1]|uniref:hypothetical protein n=1 Tax=Gordonia sp. ABSL1-1 TaxID=3053923 RepID=UPI0025729476|nr:hypothetical protein [Gordonia sp. ABSL1-1]MDL9937810.1 hypothetical protein [Gordonia sp. ABSL1-1]